MLWRCAIAVTTKTLSPHALQYAETYVPEDPILQAARIQSTEVGVVPVTQGVGAALRLLASAGNAKAVVEIGTGAGVSGVWLLRGMRPDAILTTIDIEPEHQRMARRAYGAAGFATSRARVITGRALEVLPRLSDAAYDLVFVDGDRDEYAACLEAALRLLRSGGVLAVNGALGDGRVGDPAARDPETVVLREIVKSVRDSDDWVPAMLPVGTGLLCAVKR